MILPAARLRRQLANRVLHWAQAASILGLALFQLSCNAATSTSGILRQGKPIERRLGGLARHVYPFTLQAGHYLGLKIDQPGIDVAATLSGPGGATVAASDDPDGRLQPERISLVAPATGEYRLAVAPHDPKARPGSYRIELLDLRPGRPEDEKRVAAEVAFGEGRRLQRLEDEKSLRQAVSRFAAALGLWREVGDRGEQVRALNGLALVEYLLSHFDVARKQAEEALGIAKERGDLVGQATALSLLGNICGADKASLPEGFELTNRALALWRELRNPAGEGKALSDRGLMHLLQGDDATAEKDLLAALGLLRAVGDAEAEANTLTGIQGIYYDRGEIDEARKYLEQALDLSRRARRQTAEAAAHFNLARIDKLRGDLETALKGFKENLDLNRRLGARGNELAALQALGSVYNTLGDYGRGLDNYRQGLAISRQLGLQESEARLLSHIGWTLHAQGDPRAAMEKYRESLAISSKVNADSTTAVALHNLGVAKIALGRPGEGLPDLERALALRRAKGNLSEQATTLREIGTAYHHLRQPRQAAESFALALKLGQQIGSPGLTAECLYRWALLERDQARLTEALKKIEETIAIVESVRSRMASEALRTSFFGSRRDYYELYVDLLMRLSALHPGKKYETEALNASERARARGLLELIAGRIDVRHGIPLELKRRENELGSRLSWILEELRKAGSSQGTRGRELRSQLARAEGEVHKLEDEIRSKYPHYAGVRYPTPLRLAEVQRLLKGQDALLQYFLGEDRSFLFVVTRDRLATYALPGSPGITARVQTLRSLLDRPNPLSIRRYCQEAAELYDILLRPAAPAVTGKRHLLISPDGPLYFLPFEALLTGGEADCGQPHYPSLPYMLHDYAVSYVPSVSVLSSLRGPQPPPPVGGQAPRMLVAFADPSQGPGPGAAAPFLQAGLRGGPAAELQPLPNSRHEVEGLASFYPGRVKLYLGQDATERNVKDNPLLGNARRIHFATHGIVDEIRPELSALVLTPDQDDDGYLRVDEIFNLELNADLLVLSACDTGLGKQVNGEGVLGLTRAFLYAGAKSVLVSLWPVLDTGTPELMSSFYRHLDASGDKAEALRASKLDMIRAGQANPSYWAPFILAGDPK